MQLGGRLERGQQAARAAVPVAHFGFCTLHIAACTMVDAGQPESVAHGEHTCVCTRRRTPLVHHMYVLKGYALDFSLKF